jgi:geranylgeranyl pyrophosphate synthase
VAGALSGGAGEEDILRLRRFGELIGWAFQVTDDILDVEESSAALGKTAGKDQAQQKATYPAVFGLAKSHEFARELALRAMAEIEPFGARAAHLRETGEFDSVDAIELLLEIERLLKRELAHEEKQMAMEIRTIRQVIDGLCQAYI